MSLEKPEVKGGKFWALLRLRANAVDTNLTHHLINSSRNASYISPLIQNEVLEICGGIV